MRVDPSGRQYYIDHNTKTTSWERPTPLPLGCATFDEFFLGHLFKFCLIFGKIVLDYVLLLFSDESA